MQIRLLRRRGRRAGFSLAELMVVIVIIGLLATVVVPNVVAKFSTAQITKATADIRQLQSAVEDFYINNSGRYPDSLEQLITPDANGRKFLDRDTVPKDPWGNEYVYYPPRGGEVSIEILSYGADGAQGGEGKDKDITLTDIKNQAN